MIQGDKINQYFPGLAVRKDLSKLVKGNALVPTYVLEYLLGQYCATDDEQSIDNNVTIDGTRYYYRTSAESTFFQDNTGDGEGFYLWDLASEDGSRTLSIDKWEGLPFQGHFSELVPAESLTLYKR